MNTIIKTTLSISFMLLTSYSIAQELSVVEANEKYGFENAQGKIVIQAEYDRAEDFSDNLALVMKNNKFGFDGDSYLHIIAVNKKKEIVDYSVHVYDPEFT